MRAVSLMILFGVLMTATACDPVGAPGPNASQVDAIPTGSSAHTMTVDGHDRTYRVYRPAMLSMDEPVPLVLMLHGGLGSGSQAERTYGWNAKADEAGFIVAYPDGLERTWNVGDGCCGPAGRNEVDDVGFVEALVADLQDRLPIDPTRTYATGISNGGMFAYRLACDTDLFAAIGPDSATLLGPCPDPSPIPVIHIHGLADRLVRFDGLPGEGLAGIDGPPVPDVLALWREAARCTDPVERIEPPVTVSVAKCPDGVEVELITIEGAGHSWPGAPSRRVAETLLGTDPSSTALDATATIWEFFAAHPRRGA